MLLPIAPCKDCTDRKGGCHSNCEHYIEWQKKQKAYIEAVNKERNKDWVGKGIEVEHIERVRRRKGRL